MKVRKLKIEQLRCLSDFELSFEDEAIKKGEEKKNQESEIIFLAGENGSGKSTILWTLAAGIETVLGRGSPNLQDFTKSGHFSVEIILSEKEMKITNHATSGFAFSWPKGTNRWLGGVDVCKFLQEYRKDSEKKDRIEIGTLEYLSADRFISTETQDTLRAVGTGEIETRNNREQLNFIKTRRTGRGAESKYRDVLRQYGTLIQIDLQKRTGVFDYVIESRKPSEDVSSTQMKKMARKINKNSHYERIKQAIAKYLPGIELRPYNEQSSNPPKMILETPTNERIEVTQLSSGEFQIVVWLIDLIQKELRNSIILWDEPEQHLHPSLAMKIPDMLRELCPRSQIWIATQSPFVLSTARAQDQIVYLERKTDGSITKMNEADSKIQSFRALTPNGFLATWGKQMIFVEGKQDIAFFQDLLEKLGIDAIAVQMTSKPGLKKLDIILREINEQWGLPIAVAVVDRDYYTPEDIDSYPLVTYYSDKSCDLEGLLLEQDYLNDTTLIDMAKETLELDNLTPSADPIKQLIEAILDDEVQKKKLYREYFTHELREQLGNELRDNKLDINDLQKDATSRLTKVIKNFEPSLSIDDVSFEYPDVLTWCKGKLLFSKIGERIGMQKTTRFFAVLSSRVARKPPKHLEAFLKKWNKEFNSPKS